LSYPTQKPEELIERLIRASSRPGDVVLDPFCGCGTAVVAAHKLGRRWIGIDITHLAVALMKHRLKGSFGLEDVEVIGEPRDLAGARALAEQDRYQFQWWALSLIQAKPVGDDRKRGADRGIDGVVNFVESGGRAERILVSVKSGHVAAAHIRDLKGVLDREKAAMGVFITLEPPTKPMMEEAASAGFYHSELWNENYPRIQICTIEELLAGKQPSLPRWASPGFAQAPKIAKQEGVQGGLLP
jgi:site-specific DNA-methyltransferase (adenine-specific)